MDPVSGERRRHESEIKTALITGASRGIGRALSVELVRAGVDVYGTGRDEAALEETKLLCDPLGSFYPRVLDVRSHRDAERTVAESERLDLCVNNAALLQGAPFVEGSVEELEGMLDVNVVGAFVVMRAAARRMLREGGGRLVDVASVASLRPQPGYAAYTASKHALAGLSKTLATEVVGQDLQVTTVYPGAVDTEIHPSGIPRDGFMDAEEVARTIVAALLASGTTVRIAELHLQTQTEIE